MRRPPPAIAVVLLLPTLAASLASSGCTRRPGLCEDGSRTAPLCHRIDDLEHALGHQRDETAKLEERAAAQEAELERLATQLADVDQHVDLFTPIGVPACDQYVVRYTRCINERMPEAARETAERALRTSRQAWRRAADTKAGRKGLAQACRSAWDAVKGVCSGD